jgi:hypothetical protein
MPPSDVLLPALLYGGLLPAAVALAVLALPVRRRPGLGEPAARALGAVALASGFLAGAAALGLVKPRLEFAGLALAAVIATAAPFPGAARAILWLGVAALAAWWVVPPGLFADDEWKPLREWCYGAVGGGVLALGTLGPLAHRRPGPLVPLLTALAAGGGAFVLERSGNALFAHLAGVSAAALLGVAVAAGLARGRAVAHGALPVAAALLPALMAEGCFHNFSDVPKASFILAAAAPVGLWVGALPGLRSARFRWVAETVAVLLPLAAAVGLALAHAADG